jgi:dienelactone hydrolase
MHADFFVHRENREIREKTGGEGPVSDGGKLMMRACLVWICCAAAGWADRADLGSEELERYFEQRVAELEGPLDRVEANDWPSQQAANRKRLLEMLGLSPLPERTPLQPTVTGKLVRDEIVVENLHFQSSPGLYVTANLYLPKKREGKIPAILYLCGHGGVKIDGVPHGNKVHYQHHGIWFARNGYACLVIDTLQLGEIEGVHHGTYNHGRWWWHARGYTPAGVEAWNCMRALDYLETRAEVDATRIGVTGRSGGGAYSWWIAAIDDRIKAAVPVAGIASLRNHVVDGCVEGHCDCMYHLNTYRWDFEQIASLIAPRPLLISNTDKDSIFPLDGVYQVYRPVRRIYELAEAAGNLGLNIEEGPHKDTQPLRTSAFHWMNRHLKGTTPSDTFAMAAVKLFEPGELKVFGKLPADEINTTIDEVFVSKAAEAILPKEASAWQRQKEKWMAALREQSFRGWPTVKTERSAKQLADGVVGTVHTRRMSYQSEDEVTCSITLLHAAGTRLQELTEVDLRIIEGPLPGDLEEPRKPGHALVYLQPRGFGAPRWRAREDERKFVQIRRRFALIGQTLDGMRVHDIRTGIEVLQGIVNAEAVIAVEAQGSAAGNTLYASLFLEKPVESLSLRELATSHREGPIYLNVLKFMDLPQAVAMAAERSALTIEGNQERWEFPKLVAKRFGWPEKQLVIKNAVRK